jgi:hypothetical protein
VAVDIEAINARVREQSRFVELVKAETAHVIVTYEAEAEDVSSEDVVRRVLETVPVP